MARLLDRIWIRFGLGIAATVLVTMALLATGVLLFSEWQYRDFYRGLPVHLQRELDQLQDTDQDDGPRAMQIYGQYWRGELLFGEKWVLLIGLLASLPVGLGVGIWISRAVTQPLESLAEAANRVALGDLSVRADLVRGARGEMADMLRNFNRMTDSLQALERERRTSAAALSHELRTPLAVLTARLHALRDGVIPAEPTEFERLLGEVEHLSRLVEDMHTLALADAGRLSLQLQPVDLDALAREVVGAFTERAQTFGIGMTASQPTATVTVLADRDRLRQVLSNLLDNGLRHARGARRIEVSVSSARGQGVLTIADDGPGLPADVLRQPFERFQGTHTAGSSSGLGLSIVQALVAAQDGSVQVTNAPEGGARFTVRLPLA